MNVSKEITTNFDKEKWKLVNKNLLAKMLSEFMYEEMISPLLIDEKEGIQSYRLDTSKGDYYIFEAKKRLFDSYYILAGSIRFVDNHGINYEVDSCIKFILDIKSLLKMSSVTVGYLIEELNNTLVADMHIAQKKITSDEISLLDYSEVEGEMTGHPWITYNKGRIGFSYGDYIRYAPEQKRKIKLFWLAVSKNKATFHHMGYIKYNQFLTSEIGKEKMDTFEEILIHKGLNPEHYYFMPVHEWQWENKIISLYAEEISNNSIVMLGDTNDLYLPQQSIRTFVNVTDYKKHHVKLPMSILNTLVYRGLPSERTVIAPKVTEFIKNIYVKDAFLSKECRFSLLGEIASVNYDHPYFTKLQGVPYQYLELLGAIWRESIYQEINEEERSITLAALLYVDNKGKPLLDSYVEKSNLSIKQWLLQLFKVVLPPLLHCLYQHGVVFSPHGQNTVLVLKDFTPHKLIMKDFVDDVNISDQKLPELSDISEDLKAVLRSEPPEGLTQFIFTGLFVCHFRYLSHIAEEYFNLSEYEFWELVSNTILDYQKQFPHLEERFTMFDLFKPKFTKLCLNRNRMIDYGYEDDGDRPHASAYGEVSNPLYVVREKIIN
jgi:siderophore synthetase component